MRGQSLDEKLFFQDELATMEKEKKPTPLLKYVQRLNFIFCHQKFSFLRYAKANLLLGEGLTKINSSLTSFKADLRTWKK